MQFRRPCSSVVVRGHVVMALQHSIGLHAGPGDGAEDGAGRPRHRHGRSVHFGGEVLDEHPQPAELMVQQVSFASPLLS